MVMHWLNNTAAGIPLAKSRRRVVRAHQHSLPTSTLFEGTRELAKVTHNCTFHLDPKLIKRHLKEPEIKEKQRKQSLCVH